MKEVLDTVLGFIEAYHIWFVLGLFVLAALLFVCLLVSVRKTKNEKYNALELLNKSVTLEDGYAKQVEVLEANVNEKDKKLAENEKDFLKLRNEKELLDSEVKVLKEEKDALCINFDCINREFESAKATLDEKDNEIAVLKDENAKCASKVSTLTADLKAAKATLADANAKYESELNALTESKGTLSEEFSKFQIEAAEKLAALKDELKVQKDINAALVIAVQEVGSKKDQPAVVEAKQEAPAKTDKIENLRREEILAVAKSIGIEGCYKMKKDEIIEAINRKLNKEKTSKPKKK